MPRAPPFRKSTWTPRACTVSNSTNHCSTNVSAENLFWVGFLVVCFLNKTNPNPRKIISLWGKKWPRCHLQLFFSFSGWVVPWVGEFVGFIIFACFCPTQHNFGTVYRKHLSEPNIIWYMANTLVWGHTEIGNKRNPFAHHPASCCCL